jgi:hypothetical protein
MRWFLHASSHAFVPGILLACLSAAGAQAQSVRGVIRDSVSNEPVAGARITLLRLPNTIVTSTATDSAGEFLLRWTQWDSVRLEVQRVGYASLLTAPLALKAGDTIRLDLKLAPAPIALKPVAVAATVQSWNLEQFRERQRTGLGRYLGPEQIAALPPRTGVQAVLRVDGRFLADDRGNGLLMRNLSNAYCAPRVFIDGMLQLPPDPGEKLPGFGRRPRGFNIDALIPPSSIRGVEVYDRATDAPVEYTQRLRTDCGIVVIWTDRGLGIR